MLFLSADLPIAVFSVKSPPPRPTTNPLIDKSGKPDVAFVLSYSNPVVGLLVVSVESFQYFCADKEFATVVAKFGSLFIAAANSFKVSNVIGALSIKLAITVSTYYLFAASNRAVGVYKLIIF